MDQLNQIESFTDVEKLVSHKFFAHTNQIKESIPVIERTRPYLYRVLQKMNFWKFIEEDASAAYRIVSALQFFNDSCFHMVVENTLHFVSQESKRSIDFHRCSIHGKKFTSIVFDVGTRHRFEVFLEDWFNYRIEKDNEMETLLNIYASQNRTTNTPPFGDIHLRKFNSGMALEIKGICPTYGIENIYHFNPSGELDTRIIFLGSTTETTYYRNELPDTIRSKWIHAEGSTPKTVREFPHFSDPEYTMREDFYEGDFESEDRILKWIVFGKQIALFPIGPNTILTDSEKQKFAYELYGTKLIECERSSS